MKREGKKRLLALLLAGAMALSLTACGGGDDKGDSGSDKPGKNIKVGLVIGPNGLGDKNMNDMAYEGLVKAQEELGITMDYASPASKSDYDQVQRMYAESGEYDLIVLVGVDQKDGITKVAAEFPDQKFSWLDGTIELPNVNSISTIWPQQTFLCGCLAGLATNSDMPLANKDKSVVGCLLGEEQPFLVEGTVGFEAGVRYTNPNATVLQATVGSFTDPGKAKEMALTMYDKGADFIQHIAGGSGLGVFNAAVEANRYAFGVGSNQNDVEPDHIVVTSLKDVRNIIYGEVKKLIDGTWKPGLSEIGIIGGGTGYTTEGSNIKVPQEIIDQVDAIKKQMEEGKLIPPGQKSELENWLKQNVYQPAK